MVASLWDTEIMEEGMSAEAAAAMTTFEQQSHLSLSPQVRVSPKPSLLTPATAASSSAESSSVTSRMDASDAMEDVGSNASFPRAVRVPLPSPSRPRLHPRYAARLAAGMRSFSSVSSSSVKSFSEDDLRPPPGITRDRDSSIFRPTPIVTCTPPPPEHSGFCSPDVSMELASPSYLHSSGPSTHSSSPSFESLSSPRRHHHRSSRAAASDVGVSDRYIPSRATSSFNFNLWESVTPRSVTTPSNKPDGSNHPTTFTSSSSSTPSNAANAAAAAANDADNEDAEDNTANPTTTAAQSQQTLLNTLLRSELLGENESPHSFSYSHGPPRNLSSSDTPFREGGNTYNNLRFHSPRQAYQDNLFDSSVTTGPSAVVNSFSLMPVGSAASQRLMAVPPKRKRRISKVPFKVLDAPALQDDFYLNLVDWSSQNVLAVGLGSCVYLWSACTSKVTKLCDLATQEDLVTSVSWAQRGVHLAVGTNRGEVQLWDTVRCKRIRSLPGHSARVGTLAWTGATLASGSRDRLIFLRDVRVQSAFTDKLTNHKQEVCGLKWSFDEPAFLASGGNDNHLHVIDSRNPSQPIHMFKEHTAAVKAITWSPHQHGLLASGGGTADRCIRFWNTLSGASLNKIDTGSQVCNLAWSQNCNEIVSTHGYSLNQIVIWRYPSMSKVATLTGHTYRVLYLSMSPDGSTIVTGAGDETLRFWQVFPGPRSDGKESSGGLLFPKTLGSVIR